MPARNRVLGCRVSGGVLTIEIGINTLAHATLGSPYARRLASEPNHPSDVLKITDKREFARDVVRELLDEAEDGSSLLTNLLDEACERAIEQGTTAFVDTREPD